MFVISKKLLLGPHVHRWWDCIRKTCCARRAETNTASTCSCTATKRHSLSSSSSTRRISLMEQEWQKRRGGSLTGCIGESNKRAHKRSQNIMFQHATNEAELRLPSEREGRRFSQPFSEEECVFRLLTQSSAWRSSRDDRVDPPLLSTEDGWHYLWYGWSQKKVVRSLFNMNEGRASLCDWSQISRSAAESGDVLPLLHRGSQTRTFPVLWPRRWN